MKKTVVDPADLTYPKPTPVLVTQDYSSLKDPITIACKQLEKFPSMEQL